MDTPLYPHVEVKLVGEDGNAFVIMAKIRQALRKEKLGDKWPIIEKEMRSGDYDNLLRAAMKYVTVT